MAKGRFRIAIDQLIEDIKPGDRFANRVTQSLEKLEESSKQTKSSLFGATGIDPEIFRDVENVLTNVAGENKIVRFMTYPLVIFAFVKGAIFDGLSPLSNIFRYAVSREVEDARLDAPALLELLKRGRIDINYVIDELEDFGYSQERILKLTELNKAQFNLGELLALWNRDAIPELAFEIELSRLGYDADDIENAKKLAKFIPGASDIIQFAVKDVFNDQVVEQFGYGDEYPRNIEKLASLQGIDPETLRWYWYAHWDVPSPRQGIEFWHRNRHPWSKIKFDDNDLDTLMKVGDIPRPFREQFKSISFRLATRVDIRRLVQTGIWTPDRALQEYKMQGYPDDVAQALVDFATHDGSTELRELSRSAIQQSFEVGRLSKEEAIDLLEAIGYSPDAAETYIFLVEYKIDERNLKRELDRLEFLYVEGEIFDSDVNTRLSGLGIDQAEINNYVEEWTLRKLRKIQLPTKADYTDWYTSDIIAEDEFKDGLRKRGYEDASIDNYLQEIDIRKREDAEKEAERVRKEQERLRAQEQRNEYREDVANLAVQIADDKLAKATIKVELYGLDDDDLIGELKGRIKEIDQHIAELKLEQARTKLEYEEAR